MRDDIEVEVRKTMISDMPCRLSKCKARVELTATKKQLDEYVKITSNMQDTIKRLVQKLQEKDKTD